jgi:cephalosporin-C deacetylase-like acetyl esterase
VHFRIQVRGDADKGYADYAGPDWGRVYGWLATPKGNGPFPVMLVHPGAGFAARPRPLEHARHRYLSLDIQVHGQDVDLDKYGIISGHYDPMNFAPDIKCPALMNGGLVDPVSPPENVFAVFARLTSKEKSLVPLPGLGQDWSAEFDRSAWNWLDKNLQ